MDHDEARARLLAERTEVADLLAGTESSAREDRETEVEDAQVYDSTPRRTLAAEGMDDAIADSLRERLAALDRALKRLDDGTYGRSVRSGAADPRRSPRGRSGGRAHRRGGPGGHLTAARPSSAARPLVRRHRGCCAGDGGDSVLH